MLRNMEKWEIDWERGGAVDVVYTNENKFAEEQD